MVSPLESGTHPEFATRPEMVVDVVNTSVVRSGIPFTSFYEAWSALNSLMIGPREDALQALQNQGK